MEIEHLVAGPAGTLVATTHRRDVQVWDVSAGPRLLAALETVHDGGHGVALAERSGARNGESADAADPDSLVLVAGIWERHGVVGYDVTSGEQLWQRKELKASDQVVHGGRGHVVVDIHERRSHVLDAATGESVATVTGIDAFACYDPTTGRLAWWDTRGRLRVDDPLADRPAVAALPPWPVDKPFPTYEVLAGAIFVCNPSPSAARRSRPADLVWCVDLRQPAELWTARPPGHSSWLLGVRRDGAVLGHSSSYDGDQHWLWTIDVTGQVSSSSWAACRSALYLPDRGLVVRSDRVILDDTSFKHVADLA